MIGLELRRSILQIEDQVADLDGPGVPGLRRAVAIAVIRNPWDGRGFVQDLEPEISKVAAPVGAFLVRRLGAAFDLALIEAYGKAALVGLDGELEHAAAVIQSLRFGNEIRTATGGVKLLQSIIKRAGPGTPIDVPLAHIKEDDARGHHQSIEVRLSDAPQPDEIVVCLAAAGGARLHARLSSRHAEEAMLAATNPIDP